MRHEHLVFFVFTSRPISLLACNTAYAFFFMAFMFPPNQLISST